MTSAHPSLLGRAGGASAAVLAFDIGGTKLATAVVTRDGAAHGTLIEPTHRELGWRSVIDRLFDMGRRTLKQAPTQDLTAVGIACGGPLDIRSGILISPAHLPGWHDVPIGPLATAEFGVPFALQNDATAAAMAEYRYGDGQGSSTMLYLTISTGVGGGAVINGVPHLGAAGNGSEFGHVTVLRGGRLCSCGRRGCIEAYASGTSIAARAREAVAAGRASSLAALPEITAADVSREAAAGDRLGREVWDETVDLLGTAVTDLVNAFEPERVVLGGGVTRAGAMLLDPIRRMVAREAMPPASAVARISLAGLGELVGVVGAGVIGHELVGVE
ncbi:MAG TPA: ROK family protein [Jatrophihabitans sp.]|jgi:glucokinase|nr:ROK family protein [Jatrophihabitans sp.]